MPLDEISKEVFWKKSPQISGADVDFTANLGGTK
jgi:hypothetical protein